MVAVQPAHRGPLIAGGCWLLPWLLRSAPEAAGTRSRRPPERASHQRFYRRVGRADLNHRSLRGRFTAEKVRLLTHPRDT